MTSQSRRYILGLGNYAMGDDGIGLQIVEQIADRGLDRRFTVVEAGNDGMLVLTYFSAETDKLLIVDAVDFGGAPGEFIFFAPEDVETRKYAGGISTHEGDVLRLIEMGRTLGLPVPQIRILAVQPLSMQMDGGLSAALAARMDDYVAAAVAEMDKP